MKQGNISQTQILVRPALVEDAPAMARVDVDTWRATYKGILPAHYLADLSYEKQEQLWRQNASHRTRLSSEVTIVTEDYTNGQIVGFASGGPCRERDSSFQGELYTLYVLPALHGLGLGRRLVQRVAEHLLHKQMGSMLVWVLAENPARKFYEACGAEFLGIRAIWVGGLPVNAAAYGWRDLHSLPARHNSL